MNTTYAVYDDQNRFVMHFAGPCRLANWDALPTGWGIERFLGDVSQGCVSLEDVRAHAEEVRQAVAIESGRMGFLTYG